MSVIRRTAIRGVSHKKVEDLVAGGVYYYTNLISVFSFPGDVHINIPSIPRFSAEQRSIIYTPAKAPNKKHPKMAPSPLTCSPQLKDFLKSLHTQSLTQEATVDWSTLPGKSTSEFDSIMLDKFIALDQDKCELIYHILRTIGATTVVEAGTSFGVSTIYLALAVKQNSANSGKIGKVIATEKEASKAATARANWERAGAEVEGVIDLRVGDLRETLAKGDLGVVDFMLLDSKLLLSLFSSHIPLLQLQGRTIRAICSINQSHSMDTAGAAGAGSRPTAFTPWSCDYG